MKNKLIYFGLFVVLIVTVILFNFNQPTEAAFLTSGAETDPIFSAWKIATPPLYTEVDPHVGTLTNTKWCTTDGTTINCTTDAPVLTNADTVDNQHFTYTTQTGQPTGLWGLSSTGTSYPYNPANFSVNYAGSCGSCSAYAETDPQVSTLTNGKWCTSDGTAVYCNANAPVLTESDPVFSAWRIATPPLYTESDPQVGTLTNAKWCTSDGSAVNCATNAPVLAEVDPKVGTLTNTKWCTTNGTTINCTSDAPVLTNADTVDNQHFTYTVQVGQPTGLWGLSSTGTSYPYNPANFSVNYASTAGSASTAGNASTATALAANGANCAAGSYPLGVDASGAVESCTAVPTVTDIYWTGTATNLNAATARTSLGLGALATQSSETDPTVYAWAKAAAKPSYAFTEISGSVTDAQVPNTITVDYAASAGSATTAGSASSASYLASNGANCSAGYYPLGVDASGAAESCTAVPTGSDIYWTGTATNLVAATARTSLGLGSLATLNVAPTATALAANGANCSAGYYPLGVDASGAAESCTAVPTGSDIYWTGTATNLVAATARTSLGLGSLATLNVAPTATALAANGANCAAGSYPLGVDASGAAESCTAASSFSVNYAATCGTCATYGESDPQVGTLTASKWCVANAGGTAIDCTTNAPGGLSGGVSGYAAIWTGANSLSTGVIQDNGATVGIGRPASSYTLHVAGSFYADTSIGTGGTVWAASSITAGTSISAGTTMSAPTSVTSAAFIYSDRNLKKNIATITDPLGKISRLRGVTFDFKKDNSHSLGLIAQEVEQVFPELVSSHNGVKMVEYGNLVAPLIEAVKAQQKEIEELKTNQANLQAQILKLKN